MAAVARMQSSAYGPSGSLPDACHQPRGSGGGILVAEPLKNPGSTFILHTLNDLLAHGRLRLACRFQEQTDGSHNLHD